MANDSKHIVFLSDGVWNAPDQDPDEDGAPNPTNVYKLFLALEGSDPGGASNDGREQEKELRGGGAMQIAKYIHGVGDSSNPFMKIVGGVFGGGIIARVVRGYTFISRNYEPGAHIHIIGFSRGAYTARMLAGMILSRGLLDRHITEDRERAYRGGVETWNRFQEVRGQQPDLSVRTVQALAHPKEMFRRSVLKDSDFVPVDSIATVGVWETIGVLGIPTDRNDKRLDRFQFADRRLSPKVKKGLHAVAVDERRKDFTPTLWEPAENVTQALFPGAHADVGGGYPNNAHESGLSNVALRWMIEQLASNGVRFVDANVRGYVPDPGAWAHEPWAHGAFKALPSASRIFPNGLQVHESVFVRMRLSRVVHDPGEKPRPYTPSNLSNYLKDGEAAEGVTVAYRSERVPTQPDDPALIDELGRRPFAEVIADRIEEVYRPLGSRSTSETGLESGSFTVHLHGPWGAGKTSVLNFLGEELKSKERGSWIVVKFNAWRQQRIRPPWWTLISSIHREAARQLGSGHSMRLRFQWLLWRIRADFLPIALALLFVYAALHLGFAVFSDSEHAGDAIKLAINTVGALGAASVAVLAFSRSLVFGSGRAAQAYAEVRSDPLGPIVKLFQKLVQAIGRPVAVFIDDLDRCESKYVVEILEGTQTLFRAAPIVYVIAADRKWISTSFEKMYADFGENLGEPGRPLGYLFLDKIFQVSTSLPILSPDLRQAYWERLLQSSTATDPEKREKLRRIAEEDAMRALGTAYTQEELEANIAEAANEPEREQALRAAAAKQISSPDAKRETENRLRPFSDLLEPNPRSMKRLVNAYAMHQAAHFLEGRSVAPEALARWTIVELRWPLLAEAFSNDPGLITRMTNAGKANDAQVEPYLKWLVEEATVRQVLFGGQAKGGVLDERAIREIVRFAPQAVSSEKSNGRRRRKRKPVKEQAEDD